MSKRSHNLALPFGKAKLSFKVSLHKENKGNILQIL